MKVEIKEIQTKQIEVVIEKKFICDKCNEEIKSGGWSAFEFDFKLRTGDCYPSGGSGKYQEMDLCESCSDNLISLLKDSGYRINERDYDY